MKDIGVFLNNTGWYFPTMQITVPEYVVDNVRKNMSISHYMEKGDIPL